MKISAKVKTETYKLKRLISRIGSSFKKGIQPVAKDVLEAAKGAVPVDSSALKRSLALQPLKDGYKIGAKTNFEFEDEHGVMHRPFLYSGKIDEQSAFLSDQVNAGTVAKVQAAVKRVWLDEVKK